MLVVNTDVISYQFKTLEKILETTNHKKKKKNNKKKLKPSPPHTCATTSKYSQIMPCGGGGKAKVKVKGTEAPPPE